MSKLKHILKYLFSKKYRLDCHLARLNCYLAILLDCYVAILREMYPRVDCSYLEYLKNGY